MTCSLVLWVCLGTPAGYVSARIYKSEFSCFDVDASSVVHLMFHATTNNQYILCCQ